MKRNTPLLEMRGGVFNFRKVNLYIVRTDTRPFADPNAAIASFIFPPAILSVPSFQPVVFKIIRVINNTPLIAGSAVNIRVAQSFIVHFQFVFHFGFLLIICYYINHRKTESNGFVIYRFNRRAFKIAQPLFVI